MFETNPTQVAGLAAFGFATLCAWRARWRGMAMVHALLFAEVLAELRHRAPRVVVDFVRQSGWYEDRRAFQVVLLGLGMVGGVLLLRRALRTRPRAERPGRLAIAVTLLALAVFAVETVSLHAIDALFYTSLGPMLAIGWLWLLSGIAVALAALKTAQCPESRLRE